MFDAALNYRRGRWEWRVYDRQNKIILEGWESTRAEAKYQSERGLFLLLMVTNPKSCSSKRSGDRD